MLKKIRRFLLLRTVTPERVRALVVRVISWFLQWATAKKAWGSVSQLPKWLRLLADFIDHWNATTIPENKDRLIADLVKKALTDEGVGRLIDEIAVLEYKGRGNSDGR